MRTTEPALILDNMRDLTKHNKLMATALKEEIMLPAADGINMKNTFDYLSIFIYFVCLSPF